MGRQKLVGWVLILAGTASVVYFLKVRLVEPGPPLQIKEWVQFFGSVVVMMIGTANVRLAAIRERNRNSLPK